VANAWLSEEVFSEVQGLAESLLGGYSVALVAYGQTSSGKTHTMEGPPTDPGVNYRMIEELFRLAQAESLSVRHEFSVSIFELYNEHFHDLLDEKPTGPKQYAKEPTNSCLDSFHSISFLSIPFLSDCFFSLTH